MPVHVHDGVLEELLEVVRDAPPRFHLHRVGLRLRKLPMPLDRGDHVIEHRAELRRRIGAGNRHPLVKARTVIGRGSDADITISDAGTSRKHVEILWDGERAMVRDMNSTNGTTLDGRKIVEAALPPDSTVTIGRTDIVFRVVAQAAPPKPPMPAADATRAYDVRDGGRPG